MEDPDVIEIIGRQLGRRPRAISAVVSTCPHELPAVVECLPADEDGRPFPTLYYCTCPTLIAAVGALESAGGVRVWTHRLRESPKLAGSVATEVEVTRRRRQELARRHDLALLDRGASLRTGVGGVADPQSVKCLHAHVAHALAHPDYEFGRAILAEVAKPWCGDARCREASDGRGWRMRAESTRARP